MQTKFKIPLLLFNKLFTFFKVLLPLRSAYISPVVVSWLITAQCQKSCTYCSINKTRNIDPELSLQEIKNITNILNSLGVAALSITGGEPLLREDIPEIIKHLKQNLMLLNINTNGLLLEKKWPLIKNNVFSFTIGLNSLSIQEAAKLLKFLKKIKRSLFRPRLYIRLLVNKQNIKNIYKYSKQLAKYCDKTLFQPLHGPLSPLDFHNASENLLTPEDLCTLDPKTKRILQKCKVFKDYCNFLEKKEAAPCFSGIFNFVIDPSGNIYNCNHLKYRISDTTSRSSLKKDLHTYQAVFKEKTAHCHCFTNDRRIDYFFRPFYKKSIKLK